MSYDISVGSSKYILIKKTLRDTVHKLHKCSLTVDYIKKYFLCIMYMWRLLFYISRTYFQLWQKPTEWKYKTLVNTTHPSTEGKYTNYHYITTDPALIKSLFVATATITDRK